MSTVSIEDILKKIENLENFEVIEYREDGIVVDKVKGIVKGEFSKEDLSELRKRKPRGKPTKEQVELTKEIARRLVNSKVKFKVIFGSKEVTIRFDLDHYLRITDEGTRIVGYNSIDEHPINQIRDLLEKYGEVKILRPVK